MDKKSLVFSTVALSAVMLSASIGVTSDVQAAERPAVTSTYEYYNAEYENCYDDDGYYIGVRYPSSDNPSAIYDESGNIIGSINKYKYKGKGKPVNNDSYSEGYNHSSEDTIVKVNSSIDGTEYGAPIVTSYKERVTVKKGETLKISDLNIKVSNTTDYYAYFYTSGGESLVYDEEGTFTENVAVKSSSGRITTIAVNISVVVSEQAPDIVGVHNVKGQKIYWAKTSKLTGYIADLSFDPKEDSDWDNKLYKPEKLILSGVKATDCHGNDITKNIKISGLNKKKYNKKQTVTLSVTDSEGRTTKKTCSVYIKDPVKKMDKYMYNCMSGMYFEETFPATTWIGLTPNARAKFGIGYFKWMEKVHVIGRHENGYWLVEKGGKKYFLSRLSDKHTNISKYKWSYIHSRDLNECFIYDTYGTRKEKGHNPYERDPSCKIFGSTYNSVSQWDKDNQECSMMTEAFVANVVEGITAQDSYYGRDSKYVKDLNHGVGYRPITLDSMSGVAWDLKNGRIKVDEKTAHELNLRYKDLKMINNYLVGPYNKDWEIGKKIEDVKLIID